MAMPFARKILRFVIPVMPRREVLTKHVIRREYQIMVCAFVGNRNAWDTHLVRHSVILKPALHVAWHQSVKMVAGLLQTPLPIACAELANARESLGASAMPQRARAAPTRYAQRQMARLRTNVLALAVHP